MKNFLIVLLLVLPTVFVPLANYQMPETIDIRITGNKECSDTNGVYYRIETVEFKEYVKTVLANEWYNTLEYESIKAGAVAVKMYAINAVVTGGKWENAHVYDCDWDMVYNPNLRFDITDKAVDETWEILLLDKKGNIFQTHFLAHYYACINIMNLEGKCLGAWNSNRDAINGMTYLDILEKYYPDSEMYYNINEAINEAISYINRNNSDIIKANTYDKFLEKESIYYNDKR